MPEILTIVSVISFNDKTMKHEYIFPRTKNYESARRVAKKFVESKGFTVILTKAIKNLNKDTQKTELLKKLRVDAKLNGYYASNSKTLDSFKLNTMSDFTDNWKLHFGIIETKKRKTKSNTTQ